MCGIIGVTGNGPVVPRLIDSLKRLEYRGYDSAGVAAVVDGHVERRRAQGKIRNLEAVLAEEKAVLAVEAVLEEAIVEEAIVEAGLAAAEEKAVVEETTGAAEASQKVQAAALSTMVSHQIPCFG